MNIWVYMRKMKTSKLTKCSTSIIILYYNLAWWCKLQIRTIVKPSNLSVAVQARRYKHMPNKHLLVLKTSWRRLQGMSWRRLRNVFSVLIFCLPRRLEDVVKTSWRRIRRRLGRHFEDVLKTSWRCLEDVLDKDLKTSWRRLENVLENKKLLRWRRLEDVFKTCLQDVLKTCLQDVHKTCLQDVYW